MYCLGLSLPLMNSFNKTEAAVFSCRLCFLGAFPFISLLWVEVYVSESDILGSTDQVRDSENMVSFETVSFEQLEDNSFKYRIKVLLLFMSISPH